MKKLLLILLCLPMIGFGQGSIISLTVFPTYPTETDTIYVLAELSFPSSDCECFIKIDYMSVNSITASTQHCLGMLTTICNTTDTFKFNPLSAGTYIFDLTLSTGFGGPPCSPGIVPDDYDTITFYVSSPTSIQEHTTNKELLKVTDLLGRETKGTKNEVLFYIYDDGTVEKRITID
jgi:hypothetical protein